MFKTIVTFLAAKFLTPAELLRLGYVSDKLEAPEAMLAATALVDRHQYRYSFAHQETFLNKVLGIVVKRTNLASPFEYLKGRVFNDATREEVLIMTGERLVMDALSSTDRIDILAYPALFEEFVQKAASIEERNPIKRRAALVKEIKVELGEIPNDAAQLIAGVAEQLKPLRS